MKAEKTDQVLVLDLIFGKQSALTAIYHKYAEKAYDLAYFLLKDTGWSEDIVQEVFVKLWNKRLEIREDSQIWPFIYTLTKRECLNKLRGIKRSQIAFDRLFLHLNKFSDSPDKILENKELAEELLNCFSNLPKQQERVFTLSRIEGLSHQEIAEKLNISQNTVKNHIVKSLKHLRNFGLSKNLYSLLILIHLIRK